MADSEPSRLFSVFNNAITTHLYPHSNSAFAYDVTFIRSVWPSGLSNKKPPLHFHPYQKEYIQVTEGTLCVDIEGSTRVLDPSIGEICILPWTNHRLYPPEDYGGSDTIRFLLSGEESGRMFQLDNVFSENWYRYQEAAVGRKGLRLVQVMAMFDAGGTYLTLPWWIPFSQTCAVVLGIVVGRWLGSLLGYQPYYRQWTSDWGLACEKMKTSIWHRRFATV
ncbi:hypothetical protein DTO271G3_7924 [Paecilomyces variotii]|nr:hypothetical protein DTO271G3_7924 [Paecilomyces variotii]